jgi:hypothetical protein
MATRVPKGILTVCSTGEELDKEMDSRRIVESGPAEIVYMLSPGTENLILVPPYDLLSVRPRTAKDLHDHISRLHFELKSNNTRYVLVFPGKVRRSVRTSDNREFKDCNLPHLYFDMIECSTYGFFLHVKTPKFLISEGSSWGYLGYY